jgi:predicted transcriptional regulator
MEVKNSRLKIAIGLNKDVETEFLYIPLKELHFYPANPRISSILLGVKNHLTDEKIYQLMKERQGEATRSLYQQIKRDGQINEPLVIYNNQVIEGNTRLWVAITLFKETGDEKWATIPCRKILGDLDKQEIDFILCNFHIKKKRDWVPYEQACYFTKMFEEDEYSKNQISEITGLSYPTVSKYIDVYLLMREENADSGKWSSYDEMYKIKQAREMIKEDPKFIKKFTTVLNKGGFKEAQKVRKLEAVLKDPTSAKKLFSGKADIDRAYEMAVRRKPAEGDPFLKSLAEITEDLKDLPHSRLEEIKDDKRKIRIVRALLKELKKFCKELGI